jgi:glycosyltransferase involved in cell wall biosynthesis
MIGDGGHMASVDVVVPCYNYGRFLADAVESVLNQEGVNLHVLIIDNASEDDSLEVASELAARDRRVKVIAHSVNRGHTSSYNEGIDKASAEYFLILDADDLLAPGALARALAVLENNPGVCFAYGVEGRLDEGDRPQRKISRTSAGTSVASGREFIRGLCRWPVNRIGANTVVRRTSAQKRAGYYRPSLPYTDDLEMWLRLATLGGVARVPDIQAIRRYHGTRMSVHYQSRQARDFIEREKAFLSFFDNEGRHLPDAAALMAQVRRGLGQQAYWSAIAHLTRGQTKSAKEIMRLSHRWRPYTSLLPPVTALRHMDRPVGRTFDVLKEALAPWSHR